jgi:predicted Holliday junction resolvase-like endonuclease
MNNPGLLLVLFVLILMAVAFLAAVTGYFLAASRTRSVSLEEMKAQGDAIRRESQEQLQAWKDRELALIRQQTFDAARGQAIQETQAQMRSWQEKELQQIRRQMAEALRGEAIHEAQQQFLKWRAEELEKSRTEMREVLSREAALSVEQWKVQAEKEIRQDAINKSQSVTMGKMTEHIVPYLPGFGFNPADARFIGSPVDLIVFDGLDEDDLKKIVFIEIKTGVSTLSTRERWIRDAILEKRVEWQEVKVNLAGPDVVQQVKSRKTLSL